MAIDLTALAKDWRVTVFSYSCGFLALTVLGLFDFISPKWKSIRKTLVAGCRVLFYLIFATVVVFLYAYLKWVSRNFEEMMPALSVGLISIYRIAQTIWGLAQIWAFRSWCKDALSCIRSCRAGCTQQLDDVDFETSVLLNEDIVDNKFTERDIPVKFNIWSLTWKLDKQAVHSCTARWSSTLLCALGDQWGGSSMSVKTVCALRSPVVSALSHCTIPIANSAHQLLSVRQIFDELQASGLKAGAYGKRLKHYIPSFAKTLNLAPTDHISGSRYSPSTAKPRFYSDSLSDYRDDLNKIVSGHRSSTSADDTYRNTRLNRQATNLDQVETLLIAKHLGSEVLETLSIEHEHRPFPPGAEKMAWDLLCKQAKAFKGEAERLEYVHRFWKLFMIPLWDKKPNLDVMQASAHLDIELALHIGQYLYSRNGSFHVNPISLGSIDPSETFNKFKQQAEYTRNITFNNCEFSLRAAIGEVRDILAAWSVSAGKHPMISSSWLPELPNKCFEFNASKYLCDFSYSCCCYSTEKFVKERFVWECQYALQIYLRDTIHDNTGMPACAELIMLFLLGYPHIVVAWESIDQQRIVLFKICPVHIPQLIWVEGNLCLSSGVVTLMLGSEEDNPKFEWQNWANAAMGLTRSWGDLCWENNTAFEGPRNLVRPVDLTRPVQIVELPPSEPFGDVNMVQTWNGWPVFDYRVCRFEIDQLSLTSTSSYPNRRAAAENLLISSEITSMGIDIEGDFHSKTYLKEMDSESQDVDKDKLVQDYKDNDFPDALWHIPKVSGESHLSNQFEQKVQCNGQYLWTGWRSFHPSVCRFEKPSTALDYRKKRTKASTHSSGYCAAEEKRFPNLFWSAIAMCIISVLVINPHVFNNVLPLATERGSAFDTVTYTLAVMLSFTILELLKSIVVTNMNTIRYWNKLLHQVKKVPNSFSKISEMLSVSLRVGILGFEIMILWYISNPPDKLVIHSGYRDVRTGPIAGGFRNKNGSEFYSMSPLSFLSQDNHNSDKAVFTNEIGSRYLFLPRHPQEIHESNSILSANLLMWPVLRARAVSPYDNELSREPDYCRQSNKGYNFMLSVRDREQDAPILNLKYTRNFAHNERERGHSSSFAGSIILVWGLADVQFEKNATGLAITHVKNFTENNNQSINITKLMEAAKNICVSSGKVIHHALSRTDDMDKQMWRTVSALVMKTASDNSTTGFAEEEIHNAFVHYGILGYSIPSWCYVLVYYLMMLFTFFVCSTSFNESIELVLYTACYAGSSTHERERDP